MTKKRDRKDKKWRLLGRKLAVAVAAAAVLAVPCSAAADHEAPAPAFGGQGEGIEFWGGGIGFYWRSTGFAPVGDWGFELFLNARPKAWRVAEFVGGSMGGTLQFNFTGGNTEADPDQTVTMVLAASAGLNYVMFAETTAELGLSIRFGGDQVVADHLGLNL